MVRLYDLRLNQTNVESIILWENRFFVRECFTVRFTFVTSHDVIIRFLNGRLNALMFMYCFSPHHCEG
jgi:hypothetical protein